MIYPRLMSSIYVDGAVNIDHGGIGFLSDATDCTVTEERNGAFTLSMQYPVGGIHWLDLDIGKIIVAKPNDDDREQPFIIKKISKPMAGSIKVDAEHISYETGNVMVHSFTCGNSAAFRSFLNDNAIFTYSLYQFVFDTNIVKYALRGMNAEMPPQTYKSAIYGTDEKSKSFLSLYGGEIKCDRLSIYAYAARGANRGVTIIYGKNLTALTQTRTTRDFATSCYPYYYKPPTYIELPERVLHYGAAEYSDVEKTVSVDLTNKFSDAAPTQAQLRQAATDWINEQWQTAPPYTLTLSFVELAKTTEYTNVIAAERVNLCDTITVINPQMGITAQLKVVKTVYDTLRGRYKSVDVGDPLNTLADTILKIGGKI